MRIGLVISLFPWGCLGVGLGAVVGMGSLLAVEDHRAGGVPGLVHLRRDIYSFLTQTHGTPEMIIREYTEVVFESGPSRIVVRCGRCRGTGTRDRDGRDPACQVCGGAGKVRIRVRGDAFVRCGFCEGDGTRDRDGRDPVCPACKGVGGAFCDLPAVVCSRCKGTGSRDRDRREPVCEVCEGRGVISEQDLVEY